MKMPGSRKLNISINGIIATDSICENMRMCKMVAFEAAALLK